ncbi:unnamed protein product [Paramecium octaurelia]|uniref:Uncharacterized protein n=1 Tax=Paramecium octaurelia TaxID=43137 RepID=A0A8S1VNJ9_PAROT|nr:unnamed protein product [Paramecium octaurelia]
MFLKYKDQDTSLVGVNLVKCNLSESIFENIDISGVNLNRALLINCKWSNIKINELHQLNGHNEEVYSVCFSPDGNTLASGSGDKTICLWDAKTGLQKIKLEGHNIGVTSLLVVQMLLYVYGMLKRRTKSKLEGHQSAIYSVCFSPDGTLLASGSRDNSIWLWDIQTGLQKIRLEGHSDQVQSVSFSLDGTILVSGSADCSIRLWDVKTGDQKSKLDGHSNYVCAICFSPDCATLASCSDDNTICFWDVQTGQQQSKLEGHSNWVSSIVFSHNGTTLVSGSEDKSVLLWDVKTGHQKLKLDGPNGYVYSVCISPDSTTIASGNADKSIRLWDITTEQQKTTQESHSSFVQQVCFSPDGDTIASGSGDKSIRVWDVKQESKSLNQRVIPIPFNQYASLPMELCQHLVAEIPSFIYVRLWDVKALQLNSKLEGHGAWVSSVCFSPDGSILASGSYDNSIFLWDVKQDKSNLNSKVIAIQYYLCASLMMVLYQLLVVGIAQSVYGMLKQDNKSLNQMDKSIILWDVQREQQSLPSQLNYPDILETQVLDKIYENANNTNIPILIISEKPPKFSAQGAIIFKGDFINHQGINLRNLFNQKGNYILDSQIEFQQKQN